MSKAINTNANFGSDQFRTMAAIFKAMPQVVKNGQAYHAYGSLIKVTEIEFDQGNKTKSIFPSVKIKMQEDKSGGEFTYSVPLSFSEARIVFDDEEDEHEEK